jgi:hypothetical protein
VNRWDAGLLERLGLHRVPVLDAAPERAASGLPHTEPELSGVVAVFVKE